MLKTQKISLVHCNKLLAVATVFLAWICNLYKFSKSLILKIIAFGLIFSITLKVDISNLSSIIFTCNILQIYPCSTYKCDFDVNFLYI